MEKKKVGYEQIHTKRDEKGDLKYEETYREFKVPQENDYVKLYFNDISLLFGLSKTRGKVLMSLLTRMDYGNIIPTFKPIKRMVAEHTGVSLQTVNQSISEFSKLGILVQRERGIYVADPKLFGRGKFRDIEKLRLCIEYTDEGKVLNTERYEKLKSPGEDPENIKTE